VEKGIMFGTGFIYTEEKCEKKKILAVIIHYSKFVKVRKYFLYNSLKRRQYD
jgi:hypothetical protein